MKVWPAAAVIVLQLFLFLAHWFIFHTVVSFWPLGPTGRMIAGGVLFLLAISFVCAALPGFHHDNAAVRFGYRFAATWLGFLNFVFWASWLCWIIDLPLQWLSADSPAVREIIAGVLYGTAIFISFIGLANARNIRERRVNVTLPNLPEQWKGRTALLFSDVHLGHINQEGFASRVAGIAQRLNPDIIFIAGDLYDGAKIDAAHAAGPIFALRPPLGIYFAGGNHEEFGEPVAYETALRQGSIHVLHSERIVVDGIQVIGVSYTDSTHPLQLRTFLESLRLAGGPPSILLNHVPSRLPIVEHAGVSLQLSGHTHGGQVFPFTWVTRRAFGKFTYGLQRFGNLQVLTSSGVGTWGPPMRVGTAPEVILITFA